MSAERSSIAARASGDEHLLYRGLALGVAGAGASGVAFAAVTTDQNTAQRLACVAVGLSMVAVAAWFWRRPIPLETIVRAAPSALVAFGLIFVGAVAAASGMANTPLWFATSAWVAVGGAMLTGRWWMAYGLLAAATALVAGFASGENSGLGAKHAVGWVLVGAPLMFVNSAYFGRSLGGVIVRLRRLEGVLALERERIATLFAGLVPISALLSDIRGLIEKARQTADSLPVGRGARLLAGVAESRAQIAGLARELPDPDRGPSLRVLLEDLCASYTHLRYQEGARLRVRVAPDCDEPPLRIAEGVKEIVLRSLDNVSDRCARPERRAGPINVEIQVDSDGQTGLIRCTITDDAEGVVPDQYGEGSELSERVAAALGGRFFYEQGPRGVRAAVELPLTAGPTLTDARDQPRERLTPVVARALSQIFRATRWAAGLSMIAEGALDVTRGSAFSRIVLAILAATAVEALMARAGLRGERAPSDSRPWVFAAVGITIVASGVIAQADQFQTGAWAAMVMVEVAWRYGWKPWLAAEMIRIPVVVLTMEAPRVGIGFGLVSQVIFPLAAGIMALGAQRLVFLSERLEAQVGSASERWSAITTAMGAAQKRHDIVGPLYNAIDGDASSFEFASLRERLQALDDGLRDKLDEISRTCAPTRNLLATIKQTLEIMVAPASVTMVSSDIDIGWQGLFPGSLIERFGRRNALLELLAKTAEACVERCPPHPWGTRRLRRLEVNVSQSDREAPIYITVIPIPEGHSGRNLESEVALFAAPAGAVVEEGLSGGAFRFRLTPALVA